MPSEAVTPEVIEPTQEIQVRYTPSIIDDNLAALDAWIDQQLEPFVGAQLDPEDEQQVKQARKFMADLNKLKKPIDDERKRVKREYSKPLDAFEMRVKTITGKIDAARDNLKQQVAVADAAFRNNRRAELALEWEGCAGKLTGIIDFDAVCEDSWLNRSTPKQKAERALYDKAEKALKGYVALDEMTLNHRDEVVRRYCQTLDLQKALQHEAELNENDRRMEEFRKAEEEANERRRAAREAEQAALADRMAREPEPIAAPMPEPMPVIEQEPDEPEYRWELMMTFAGTRRLAEEVGAYLKSRGITGAKIHCIGRV